MVAACYFLCVYCMLRYKSNKIHRYSVNTYYVQSTVLGASQYEFYPTPCQWLAVWFWASPLILVCLISLTCKVGVTIVPAYLPHRGVVRIHVVTYGALNLSEEVWHKHILFFNVLPCVWRLEGKGIPHLGNSGHSHSPKRSQWNTHQGTVRTLSSSSLWPCLNRNLLFKEPWKCFYRSSTATNSLQFYCTFAEKPFFRCLNAHWNLVLCWFWSVKLPTFGLLGGIKLRNRMDLIVVKGKGFDWFL